MKVEGVAAVVTGAGSGIGRATAEQLMLAGARVLATDVRPEGLQGLAERFPQVHTLVADASHQSGIEATFAEAQAVLGGVQLFIANAGYAHYGNADALDFEAMQHMVALNQVSPLYTVQRMAQLNAGQRHKTVLLASAMAHWALPGYALYAATKAALHRYADAYRAEAAPGSLCLVYPIGTRTRFFEQASPDTPRVWPTQSPERVARAILRGIRRNARRVYPSPLFRGMLLLNRLLPLVKPLIYALEKRKLKSWLRRHSHPQA